MFIYCVLNIFIIVKSFLPSSKLVSVNFNECNLLAKTSINFQLRDESFHVPILFRFNSNKAGGCPAA